MKGFLKLKTMKTFTTLNEILDNLIPDWSISIIVKFTHKHSKNVVSSVSLFYCNGNWDSLINKSVYVLFSMQLLSIEYACLYFPAQNCAMMLRWREGTSIWKYLHTFFCHFPWTPWDVFKWKRWGWRFQ